MKTRNGSSLTELPSARLLMRRLSGAMALSRPASFAAPLARRLRRGNVVVCAAAFALTPALARAQTDTWNGGNGDWDVAADWLLGMPMPMFDVENDTSGNIAHSAGTDTVKSFLNTSTGSFSLTGGTLATSTFFKNTGSGAFNLSGGTLNVGSNFLNTVGGAINLSGATVNVSGNFTNSGMGIVTVSEGTTTITGNLLSAGAMNLTGGVLLGLGAAKSSLEVDNSFTMSRGTLANWTVNAGSGGQTLMMQGGTLQNDTLNETLNITDGSNTLDNVTIKGDPNITSNEFTFVPHALSVSGTTTVTNTNYLIFNNATANSTLGLSNIVLGGATSPRPYGALLQTDGNTLTIDASTTVHGSNGQIGSLFTGTSDTLINNGTINADVSNGQISISDTTFTNSSTGTLMATNGGTLNLNSSTSTLNGSLAAIGAGSSINLNNAITVANGINFNSSNGGTINLNGTLDAGGQPLTIGSGALTVPYSGTLKNATVNVGIAMQGGTLQNDTINSNLTITSSNNTLDTVSVKGDLNFSSGSA